MIYCSKKISSRIRGFSLIEMVVTLAIFALLMSISFSAYPRMTQALGFNAAVSDTSYMIKETQISGTSRGDFTGDGYSGEGVYFDRTTEAKSFYIKTFLDKTDTVDSFGESKSNKVYDSEDQTLKDNKNINQVKIVDLCVGMEGQSKVCNKQELSITFIRPTAQANISDLSSTVVGYNF